MNVSEQNCSIECTNIETLVPIMVKKLLGCINFNLYESDVVENANFALKDLGVTYEDNAPICISNLWYSYDDLGVSNNPINGRISCENINLYGTDPGLTGAASQIYPLYTQYSGMTSINCCECMDQVKFIETQIEFTVENLVITIQGTIGSQPFIGTYTYSGSIA